MNDISVVIPTLLKSHRIYQLIEDLNRCDAVKEIILINNSDVNFERKFAKLLVLHQDQNIFVNPAWNLGVKVASGKVVFLINDDITFDSAILDKCAKLLLDKKVGLIGLDIGYFENKIPSKDGFNHRRIDYRNYGFGTLMAFAKSSYVEIPEDMKIWCGDDWLFWNSPLPVHSISGFNFETEMSTSSGDPKFGQMKENDIFAWSGYESKIKYKKFWHYTSYLRSRTSKYIKILSTFKFMPGS